jgi:hypothetical protein
MRWSSLHATVVGWIEALAYGGSQRPSGKPVREPPKERGVICAQRALRIEGKKLPKATVQKIKPSHKEILCLLVQVFPYGHSGASDASARGSYYLFYICLCCLTFGHVVE